MGKANLDRVRHLLGSIAEAEQRLRQLGQMPEAEFLSDFRNTESAKYLFVVAIEAAIDVCNHLVAKQGGRSPRDYADCFQVLAEMGILRHDFAERLAQMARFRNLLVHLYWQVDNRRVYQVIRDDLLDLEAFRQAILGWLG
ncbi:MAG: DUF86 domain-containing protein [Anaerolineales bacterium]|nr:DUF86 domain-containing protein [Anaerolineales bacterium]MDW8445897.1 DUF86 domain-containing protein [Anaerolineales bacterium]